MKINYIDISIELNINNKTIFNNSKIIDEPFNFGNIEGKRIVEINAEKILKEIFKDIQKKGYEF